MECFFARSLAPFQNLYTGMECHISTQVPAFCTQSCNLDAKDPAFFLKNSTEMVAGLSEFVVTVHQVFMTVRCPQSVCSRFRLSFCDTSIISETTVWRLQDLKNRAHDGRVVCVEI